MLHERIKIIPKIITKIEKKRIESISIESKTRFNNKISLESFMEKHCLIEKNTDIPSKVALLYREDPKKIELPPLACEWKSGQTKFYFENDLKNKWNEYRNTLTTLPELK